MDYREPVDLKQNSITNAVLDAALNSLSNILVSHFASGVLDTDLATVSTSHDTLASAKAIKTYIDSVVTGTNQDLGSFDASPGVIPATGSGALGALVNGDHWHISVAGTIPGVTPAADLQVGDLLYCYADGATLGSQFFSIQGNIAEATSTVLGLVMLATEPETQLKAVNKVVTAAALTAFSRTRVITVTTDGIQTTHTVVHNLGKSLKDLQITLRDATTEVEFKAAISKAPTSDTNQFVVTSSPAYPAGGYNVVITGL